MKNWCVKLIESPKQNDFRSGFFPRYFHYKKDAINLQKEVNDKGGKAVVERALKAGPKSVSSLFNL